MKLKRNKGFTLAETLIVVAIALILMGIAFVGVARYRRSMRQIEFDGYAREIFIAAQNHLTMADNQGMLGVTNYGTQSALTVDVGKDIRYFIYDETKYNANAPTVLDLMLPFGAVDETVRTGGTYIIRYQKSSARIVDVFFSSPSDQSGLLRNLGKKLTSGDYSELVEGYSGAGAKANRRNYKGVVVGWYGGDDVATASKKLEAPSVQIINAEKLTVKITNPNLNVTDGENEKIERLTLYIKGKTTKAEASLVLSKRGSPNPELGNRTGTVTTLVLDDITTAGSHFAQLFCGLTCTYFASIEGNFLAGEDLEIWAEADSTSALANIARSKTQTTNSLFAKLETGGGASYADTADIAYIRHLENLDGAVSGFTPFDGDGNEVTEFSAKQVSDLSWTQFKKDTDNDTSFQYPLSFYGSHTTITNGTFYPLDPVYTMKSYDGQSHSISDIEINTTGNAGLFAQLNTTEVSNLELIDFNVTSTGEGKAAGALAGKAVNADLKNVLAHSTRGSDIAADGSIALGVSASKGDAGGLVGSMSGGCSVTDCAAALFVNASGNAGGLIGSSAGTTVENSYSGGHTKDGKYQNATTGQGQWNVKGGTSAGGLIGSSESDTLRECYSTCSAQAPDTAATGQDPAAIAGGLIGSADKTVITNCYATGLVSKGGKTFVGKVDSSVSGSGNLYFGAVNPDMKSGADDISGSISASKSVYVDFFFKNKSTQAMPYDTTLIAFYQNNNKVYYPMKASGASSAHFAAAHYGDWPMPDALIYNG